MEGKEDQEKNQINKEKVRDTKENVLQKFRSLKQINKLNKLNLISLLENCNTIEDIIIYYLDYLKLTNDDDYKNELKSYYTIISPRECKKHGIMKVSERHKFHDLMNFIIKEKEIKNYVKKELTEVSKEINHLYEEEVKDLIDEKEKEKRKEDFIRWDNIYNTNIDFNDIYNEEYFYYKLSNDILRDLNAGQIGIYSRREGIKFFYDIFKKIENDKKKYKKYFSFICLGLLIINTDDNNKDLISNITHSMMEEINSEFLSLQEIEAILKNRKAEYSIKEKQININYKNKNLIIDNYENYNFTEDGIFGLFAQSKFTIKNYLVPQRNFSFYMDKNNYFDGLLIKIISKYVKSNFSKTSIENLFKIKKEEYTDLFKEITTDKILDYILFIPHNNFTDTERTLKLYSKIIIDPLKNVFNESVSLQLISVSLKTSLKKFVNIVKRKYLFEHEQIHLVTILLFYLYLNEKRKINSLPRQINESNIEFLTDEAYKIKKAQKNVSKEAGNSFEILCYGGVQKKFKLKELLFIANENNDDLNFIQHKEQYKKCYESSLDELLNNFPKDQILSNLVQEIKEGLEEEKKIILERAKIKKSSDEILNNYYVSIAEDELPSSVNFDEAELDINEEGYNNHVFEKNNNE